MLDTCLSLVIWEEFKPVASEEVDWYLGTVSLASCVLDPCPYWLVKASRGDI